MRRATVLLLACARAQLEAYPRSRAEAADDVTLLRHLPTLSCQKDAAVDKKADVAEEPVFFFVHVFKAAGSSVRELFRRYTEKCGRRWACLAGSGALVGAPRDVCV